jgi:hypothetical protein
MTPTASPRTSPTTIEANNPHIPIALSQAAARCSTTGLRCSRGSLTSGPSLWRLAVKGTSSGARSTGRATTSMALGSRCEGSSSPPSVGTRSQRPDCTSSPSSTPGWTSMLRWSRSIDHPTRTSEPGNDCLPLPRGGARCRAHSRRYDAGFRMSGCIAAPPSARTLRRATRWILQCADSSWGDRARWEDRCSGCRD